MPDDRNLLDDSPPPDDQQARTPGADKRAPWEAQPGDQPPEPQDLAPTPSPWELYPDAGQEPDQEAGPPPAAAPWESAPPAAEPESLDALRQQAGGWESWDTSEAGSEPAPAQPPADEFAWMRDFGMAAGDELPLPAEASAEDDDLSWLGEVEPGQEPPRGTASEETRKVDTDELPWLDDATFRRIPSIEPEDEFALSPEDQAAQDARPPDDAFWLDETLPGAEKPAEPAESIPDWLRQQFDAEPDAPQDSASAPPPPETPGRIPGVTRRLRPLDAEQPPAADQPSTAPPSATPGGIPGVTRRLQPLETLPPAGPDSPPDWLSEADKALDAVEAGQPEPLTFDEWERQQEEREREARKTPEERLLESVPGWFEQLGSEPSAPPAPPTETPASPDAAKGAEPEFMPGWMLGLEEQNTEEAPDWFQQLDFAGDQSAAAREPAPAEDEVPDWFKGVGASGEPAPTPAFDLFDDEPSAPRGEETPFTGWPTGEEPAAAPDEGDFVERFDPAGAEDVGSAAGMGGMPEWLRDLEDEEPPAPAPPRPSPAAPADDSLDWLKDLSPEDVAATDSFDALFAAELAALTDAARAPEAPESPALAEGELEQLLQGYETPPRAPSGPEEATWPEHEALAALDAEPDFEPFFPEAGPDQPVPGLERLFEEAEAAPAERSPAPAEQPEWVADLRPADLPVTVHAAGVEVDVPQTPVVDLPPRVHAFREKVQRELGEPPGPPPAPEAGALAGLAGALGRFDAALPAVEPSGPLSGAIVTREHQARVKKLQALLAAAEGPEEAPAAEPLEAAAAPGQAPRRARRPRRFKPDRVLIALLMLAALVAPFITDALHFADNPPPLGAAGEDTAAALDALAPGAYVLVAFEYGPTAAGELDPLVEAVLRDALVRGAIPLAISTNPAGALHAEAVLAPLAGDGALLATRSGEEAPAALVAGQDYALLGYLPGDALGVRTLAETYGEAGTVHPAFDTTLRGEATNLPIRDVAEDVALIMVAGEDTDDIRTWAEQLKGLAVPKIALVTAALEPLIDPYVYDEGYAGYLAGVRDTYSYNLARNANARRAYTLPDDLGFDLPNPEDARWHSMALGAAVAAGLIALGMVFNLLRALVRRRP